MKTLFHIFLLFWKPILWLVVITTLCLMPPQDLPVQEFYAIPHFDKVVHFGMYFVLALLLIHPLQRRALKVALGVFLISFLVGGAIEILQFAMAIQRSASWGDFIADMAGAAAGWLLYSPLIRTLPFTKFFLAAPR